MRLSFISLLCSYGEAFSLYPNIQSDTLRFLKKMRAKRPPPPRHSQSLPKKNPFLWANILS